jgi:hypothetical protein
VFISGELQHAAGHLSSLAGPRPHASGDGCGQEGATSVSIARCITCRACCEMLGMCSATCGTGAGHGGPEPYQRRSWGECLIYPPPHPRPHDAVDGSPPSLIYLSCQIESQALHPPPGLHSEPVHSTFFGLQPDTTRHMNSGLHLAGGHAIDPSASPGMFWD